MALAIMMQRAAFLERNANHLLLGSSSCLGDRLGHFACLAMAETDPALAIANHDQRSKTEALAALDGLGNAVDVNQLLDQLFAAFFAIATTTTLAIVATPAAITAAASAVAAATATATTAIATTASF